MGKKSALCKLKDFSVETKMAIIVYFYRLAQEIKYFGRNEEMQVLYHSLIEDLGLKTHAENVINAFIKRKIKTKILNPVKTGSKDRRKRRYNPYDMRGELSVMFEEDEELYDMSGNFTSTTEFDINLIRAVFAGEQNFDRIIACTFFYPKTGENEEFKIPSRISVNEKFLKALKNLNCVKIMSDAFGLCQDEIDVLNLAYLSRVYNELNNITENFLNTEEVDYLWIFEMSWYLELAFYLMGGFL